jgi:hypothetical protein
MPFRPNFLSVLIVLSCSGMGAMPAQATDGLLDFSVVNPPAVQDRTIKEPVVTWSVQPDAPSAEKHCKSLSGFDGGNWWREGCVLWSVEGSRCTMVTTQNTTHTLMGRLLLMCMAAKVDPL